jgi:pimeloyl-ACP methyl ester carboxylesterase
MKHRSTVLPLIAILSGLSVPGLAAETPRRPVLAPCQEPGIPAKALCGTWEVFENRAARSGRKIPLKVLVLPATGGDRLPDPVIYFAGGPGDASIPEGLFFAQQLEPLRARHDFLLVDFRGTGGSGGLFCTETQGRQGVQDFLDNFLPTAPIHACRDRLKKEHDLSWYTTDAATDDVEEVRLALGYGKVNLMGGSYGTRAVQTYLRRHPQGVRTATMLGVVAPDEQYPLGLARATQNALDGWIAECAADAACHRAFPELRQDIETVLRRVAADPVKVEVTDPETGAPFELRLGRRGVAQTLRYMLYSTGEAVLVPLMFHEAAQGNWKPLAQSAYLHASAMSSLADGYYQSVTCAEDVSSIREEEIGPAVAGTFIGDFRVRQQKAACEGWPMRDLGPEIQAPVVSDVPSLLVSGERDPATPAANGAKVARTLKRGRHVVIEDGGHSTNGMTGNDCLFGRIAAFIEAGAAEKLDLSCLKEMRRPEFATSFGDPEVTVARADLERLAGSYENKEAGLAAQVDLVGNRLRITFSDGFQVLLIPTAPTRFRFEGMGSGRTAAFQLTDGKATAVTVSQGEQELVLPRTE